MFGLHQLVDLLDLLGKVELGQQLAESVEHGADEGFLALARQHGAAGLAGQQPGQVGAQEVLLQLAGVGFVLQMLEQQHGDGDVADGVEAEHDHCPRHGADVAAAGLAVVGGVDQAQDLVGQRIVLEDAVGQRVDALAVRVGQLVDGRDRVGQRREVAAVTHAPQQEFQSALLARLAAGSSGGIAFKVGIQRLAQFGSRREAPGRIECAGAQDDVAQTLVDARFLRQGDRLAHNALDQRLGTAAAKHPLAGQHLQQHQASGEHVHSFADHALADVLGSHVGRRADQAGIVLPRIGAANGDTEVHDARHPRTIKQDVGGLEVAVDNAQRMRLGQGVGHLAHQMGGTCRRHRPTRPQDVVQAAAVDVFEYQVDVAVLFAGIVDGHDVRVMELADGTGFVEQRRTQRRVGLGKVEGLDRHFPLQLWIPGKIDHALAAASKFPADFETADGICHGMN